MYMYMHNSSHDINDYLVGKWNVKNMNVRRCYLQFHNEYIEIQWFYLILLISLDVCIYFTKTKNRI